MVTCLYADIGTRLLAYESMLKVFFYCLHTKVQREFLVHFSFLLHNSELFLLYFIKEPFTEQA